MATSKPEVLRSQLVDQIGTKFQRLHPSFWGPATQWKQFQCCAPNRKSEIPDGGPKPAVLKSHLVDVMATKFQRLPACFWGSSNSMEIVLMLCDINRKSNIPAGGLVVGFPTSGLVRQHSDHSHEFCFYLI